MKQYAKDCPICGARPDIFQDAKGKWDVMCPNCDHHGALTAICDKDTAQDAIEAWNKQTVEHIENEFPELKKPWRNFGDFQDWKI